MTHYKLNDSGVPVEESDVQKWSLWFETAKVEVGYSKVGEAVVMTKFVGVSWTTRNPHLWQSEVTGGALHGLVEKCLGSWEAAEAMHAQVVQRVERTL